MSKIDTNCLGISVCGSCEPSCPANQAKNNNQLGSAMNEQLYKCPIKELQQENEQLKAEVHCQSDCLVQNLIKEKALKDALREAVELARILRVVSKTGMETFIKCESFIKKTEELL